jgi:hypothetical protein
LGRATGKYDTRINQYQLYIQQTIIDLVCPFGLTCEFLRNPNHPRWMKGLRNVHRGSQRIEKEMEIRSNLANWDEEFPFMHHELIVRYAAGLLASTIALTIYDLFRAQKRRH